MAKLIAHKRERYGRSGGRYSNLYGEGRGAGHPLTGFLKFGVCDGPLTIVSGYGANRNPRYGCANHALRHSCSNDLRERESAIQERLFPKLQSMVLTDEIVSFAIEEFGNELRAQLSSTAAHLDADRKQEARLQGKLKKLTAFILTARDSDDLEPIRDEINERNRELKLIRERILGTGRDSIEVDIAEIREYVTKGLGDVVGLKQDTAVAKAWLREHVQRITMTPAGERKNRYYVASGDWRRRTIGCHTVDLKVNLANLQVEDLGTQNGRRPRTVEILSRALKWPMSSLAVPRYAPSPTKSILATPCHDGQNDNRESRYCRCAGAISSRVSGGCGFNLVLRLNTGRRHWYIDTPGRHFPAGSQKSPRHCLSGRRWGRWGGDPFQGRS